METIQSEVTISLDLTWLHHIKVVVKKASRPPDLLKHHLLNVELHQKELLGWGVESSGDESSASNDSFVCVDLTQDGGLVHL